MPEIINLFFVPAISLCIVFKQKGWPERYSPKLIAQYAIFAVTNLLITKLILKILALFLPMVVDTTGLKYTLVAAVVAVLLPYLADFMRKYISIQVEIGKYEEDE